jgi:hypothetical protein
MTCVAKVHTIFYPPEESREKQISDEIHDRYVHDALRILNQSKRVEVVYNTIKCPISQLSDDAQKYLYAQGCDAESLIVVLLNMEETAPKFYNALPGYVTRQKLYKDKGKEQFAGYTFCYYPYQQESKQTDPSKK